MNDNIVTSAFTLRIYKYYLVVISFTITFFELFLIFIFFGCELVFNIFFVKIQNNISIFEAIILFT
ncbi:hypothetical protein DBR27_13570 [Flavobacterium sp. HMWF030]|nr:hypothetical protein DBR27_13570 [Flavobacterium sp. HMWF030]